MRRSCTHHRSLLAACLALTMACGDDDDEPTTTTDAGGQQTDAGGEPSDAGGVPADAGVDAGEPVDAGGTDAGETDAGLADAGMQADAGDDGGSALRSVDVTADEFEFTPNEITVAPGTTLTVNLSNAGDMDHSIEFEIDGDEFELDDDVAPGAEGALTFTVPDEPGEFEFYCPIGNHRELGMTGTLIVEE